jgi:hypothetical protein
MKLIALTLPIEKPPELRLQRYLDLANPVDTVLGWRVLVRGSAVILLDPKGKGHEISRAACVLTWDGTKPEDYDSIAKYTSEPIARPQPKLTDEELERATAPARAVAK